MRFSSVMSGGAGLLLALLAGWPQPAAAYIGGPPATLGLMCSWSTHLAPVRVERVDRDKGIILFRKLGDYKGKWPAELIRQVIPAGLPERERIFAWAEPGKTTVMFALESYRWSHTYIDSLWYASTTTDWQNWQVSHGEPILLRTYSGKPDRLMSASTAILAGKDVIVPCLSDGSMEDLRLKKTKVQRLKANIKLLDYNPKRDFVGWGGDDFATIQGMPGFTHFSTIGRVDPEAQVISCADFNDDGKLDLCLAGGGKVLLLQNAGDYWSEVPLPISGGCRAAVWADYNQDGLPDLLLATADGPKLLANQGQGVFRDASALLPRVGNVSAIAWLDHDRDGRPDILLATAFLGLRLYRNQGSLLPTERPRPGQPLPLPVEQAFEDISEQVGLGPDGHAGSVRGDALHIGDVNGDGRPDCLFGATLLLNTASGFLPATDTGLAFSPGKVSPAMADYDGDGYPDLFVPQLDGRCQLYHNDGKGLFRDVTAQAGDLARSIGMAVSAVWGDFDNDGRLDLVVGCLKSPNHYFRNLGDGRFEDASATIGLSQRMFNSQAVGLADLNGDGMLDLICANEGQESVVLLGNPEHASGRTAVAVHVGGPLGVIGSQVRLLDASGNLLAVRSISGGDGRGSQSAPLARFALAPGRYRALVRFSSGLESVRPIVVGSTAQRALVDDEMPRAD